MSRSSSRPELSRRERQIMDAVFAHGEASVEEVRERIADPPSYSAVRATMSVLVDKGWLAFRKEGRRYLYRPVVSKQSARRSALRKVVDTFFDGSAEDAMAALLDLRPAKLEDADLDRLADMIERAREDGA